MGKAINHSHCKDGLPLATSIVGQEVRVINIVVLMKESHDCLCIFHPSWTYKCYVSVFYVFACCLDGAHFFII